MKKMFATLLLGSVLSVAALAVPAQQSGAVTITPGTGSAQVRLDLPESRGQDITTVRLSVTIASTDTLQASFVFDDAVQSSVREYRYDADSGRLNIYLSGRSDLFAEGTLDLGEVRLTTAEGSAARATVSAAANCLEFRNAALGKTDQPDITPVSAEVTLESKAETPPADLPDSQPGGGSAGNSGNNAGNTDGNGSGNSGHAGNGTAASPTDAGSTQTSAVEETTLVTTTPVPGTNTAGQGSASGQNTNSGKGTAAPSATPSPETEDPSSDPAGEAESSSGPDKEGIAESRPGSVTTPEQAAGAENQTSPLGLVLGIIALVVIAAGSGIVVFLRRRG